MDVPPTAAGAPSGPTSHADIPSLPLERIKAYNRTKRSLMLAGMCLSLVYWIAWVAGAGAFVEWLDRSFESPWAGLLIGALIMMAVSVVISLPLDFYSSYTVEHRYELSNQSVRDWLIFQVKTWLVGAVIGAVLLIGLYAALWHGGRWWGVWVWAGVMLLSVVLAKVFPLVILPLFYPSTALDRPSLSERLTRMAERGGLKVTGIFNLGLSKDTRKANAMLAGLGASRRVYLADTLLSAFNDDQIMVVFAHELGHHIRRHILKGIALSAVVSSVLVAAIWWRLHPWAGQPQDWAGAVGGLAQVMLVLSLLPLAISPATNAIMRYFEHQADWLALELTGDAPAYRGAFDLLTRMNLADPDPPAWEVIFFDDHPPMSQRLAAADRWEAARA